jgi:hypothetical protein
MYQLWARKRPTENQESNFEFITEFDEKIQQYSLIDTLDESIYQEAIVISNGGCELYVEFEKPFIMKMRRNNERKNIKNR